MAFKLKFQSWFITYFVFYLQRVRRVWIQVVARLQCTIYLRSRFFLFCNLREFVLYYKKISLLFNRTICLPQSLNIVGTISSSCEVWQVELNLIPSLVKSHWHSTDERFHTGSTLIVGCSKSSSNVLII